MQFELLTDSILVFFKEYADLERVFQFIVKLPIEKNPYYVPSNEVIGWELSLVKPNSEGQEGVLKFIAEQIQRFLGRFGKVELKEDRVLLDLPDNFYLDKFFKPFELCIQIRTL